MSPARSPKLPRVLAVLCVAAVGSGAPVLARAAPESPVAVPTEAEQSAQAGSAAANQGDYEGALRHYARARELDPELDVDEPLAMAHYQIGTKAYASGDYQQALAHFQDAQGLYSSPSFHYNIAQCYEALERPMQAIDSYRAFLRAVPDTPDRANIENKIARLEKRAREREQPKEPARASTPVEPAPPASTAPDTAPKKPGRALVVSGSVLLALGGAVAIGGGTAWGVRAADRTRRVEDVFEGGNPEGLSVGETETLDREGRQAETAQIVSLAAGGAVAVVGVTLLAVGLVEGKRHARGGATPSAWLAPGSAGLSLTGRF